VARGCYWCNSGTTDGTPWCFIPREQGYRVSGGIVDTAKGYSIQLVRIDTPSRYGSDFKSVQLEVEFNTADRLHLKFTPLDSQRFQVPLPIESPPTKPATTQYDITFTTSPVFSFKVTRKSTGAVIFDTSIGGLQLSDQFLQIATRLETPKLYGFGEHEHRTMQHNMSWTTWPMYSRDQATTDSNLYGVHPFYVNVESSGNAHGVLFLNANAQEVHLMPAPALTYRTIGGILDIYMFLGPTPDSIVQQYTAAVGRPLMVPYWALGFQLCRWGYKNLDAMKAAVNRMRQYDIPHDIQYADIDYMDSKRIFTLDTVNFGGLPQYVNELKQQGTRFIIILDPAVYSAAPPGNYTAFDAGNAYDVWVKNPDGNPSQGEVWPGPTYFPDFTNPSTQNWWTEQCVNFKNTINYDALWIDMNEPANFVHGSPTGCANTPINSPPYTPAIADRNVQQKTLCLDRVQMLSINYNTHSLYGWSMAQQSLPAARAATGKRSVVFSRSTFVGANQWGQHWLGDNWSDWDRLRYSLIGVMEFNMFGFPYVGPDICGFIGNTTEELCQRWQQIGAFFTFSRNHNADGYIEQDPGMWPAVAATTRETLHIRYTLLPFLYTLMHKAHTEGTPVIRPLFFDFPGDANTLAIDQQMQWGSALLLSPVLTQGAVTVQAYFPDARHYSYYDGAEVPVRRAFTTLSAPLSFIPIHVRGGHILPTQQPANSTMWSRLKPLGLLVALDDNESATGSLFWDDGESIDTFEKGAYDLGAFSASPGQLTAQMVFQGTGGLNSLRFDDVRVMGIKSTVTSVTVNGAATSSWTQDSLTRQLTLSNLGLNLTSSFTITWS
jgi:alpha-glucosidase (family GH31 glycosyl hydrolase)